MGTAMGRQAVVSIVALQGLLLAACGATSTGQPAAGPTTTMGATVQTVRTGATVGTTDSALAGLPEILTPPPGVAVAPSSTPGSLTLDVGGDPATTLTPHPPGATGSVRARDRTTWEEPPRGKKISTCSAVGIAGA